LSLSKIQGAILFRPVENGAFVGIIELKAKGEGKRGEKKKKGEKEREDG